MIAVSNSIPKEICDKIQFYCCDLNINKKKKQCDFLHREIKIFHKRISSEMTKELLKKKTNKIFWVANLLDVHMVLFD